MALTDELILEVMDHLPAASLYCLRQTSTAFMAIFNRHQFSEFHQKSQSPGHHLAFNVKLLSVAERNAIADSLHHHMYCHLCLEAEENGSTATRLKELRSLRYCDGCEEPHAGALFFSDDKHRYDTAPGKLLCIGRLEKIPLCKHSSDELTTWLVMEEYLSKARALVASRRFVSYETTCTHRGHHPGNERHCCNWSNGCPFPRLIVAQRPHSRSLLDFCYGWDLPILDIDFPSKLNLSDIRKALSSLVVDALCDRRMCPHLSISRDILAFVESGTCDCFTGCGAWTGKIDKRIWRCGCERQYGIQCRICGVKYSWGLSGHSLGRITLECRHAWGIAKPTNLGWLSLMAEQDRAKIFSEDTRHVLWCDTPGCRTSTSHRWEALVKEDAEREFKEGAQLDPDRSDYAEMLRMSENGSFQHW